MNSKTTIAMILLTAIIVGLSGCVQQTPSTPFDVTPTSKSVNIDLLIEERTGVLSSDWQTKPTGWYNRYQDKTETWYTDNMVVSSSPRRDVQLLLITEDPNPILVISSADIYYKINTNVARFSSVPRGYPSGGKRIYEVTITYTISDMKDGNLLSIKDNYYDVIDKIFHIEFNSKKPMGYS